MLDLIALMLIVCLSFTAGYATRAHVSRRRRANYLKWEPYVRSRRSSNPPAFLVRPTKNQAPMNQAPMNHTSKNQPPRTYAGDAGAAPASSSQDNTRRPAQIYVGR